MTTPPKRLASFVAAEIAAPHHARRLAAVAIATAVYVMSYPVFEALSGVGAGAFAILPVSVVAWFYGARIGIVAAVLAIPVNLGLELLTSDRTVEEWLKAGGVIGHAALIGTTLVIGFLRDMTSVQ